MAGAGWSVYRRWVDLSTAIFSRPAPPNRLTSQRPPKYPKRLFLRAFPRTRRAAPHGTRRRNPDDEENIPAKQPEKGPHPRFPCPHGHPQRPQGDQREAGERPRQAHALRLSTAGDGTGFGFPKSARLLSPRDFQRVFKGANRSADRFFTVLFRNNGTGLARLGLAISKKQLKRAVDRNRVKRLVRESFRSHRGALGGVDVVVLSGRGIDPSRPDALTASIEKHWLAVSAAIVASD